MCDVYFQTNTFQAILITDGTQSYAIFHYGDITWTYGAASSRTPAQVTIFSYQLPCYSKDDL